jgi:hypothetical protein
MNISNNALDAIKTQMAAVVLLGLLESDSAPPDAIYESLLLMPERNHREFLRAIQKHIENNPHSKATGLAAIVGVTE